ncbi:hypothetical protein BLOT_009514 [Blomia tropicalis]|nr:hypothetical protein BLOT_009514 [Blomia tropicalis]
MENTVLDYVLATPPQQQQKNMKALVSVSVRPVNSGRVDPFFHLIIPQLIIDDNELQHGE